MRRKLTAVAIALAVPLAFAGYALATHVTEVEEHVVPCVLVINNEIIECDVTITDTDNLPHETTTLTETTTDTETTTVTVTEPPPTTTEPPPTTTEPPPDGEPIVCTTENYSEWGPVYNPGDCVFGTTITRTNAIWSCNQPLAAYGELPIRVVQTWTIPMPVGQIGAEALSGCTGGTGNEVNLIVEQTCLGAGRISDPFKTRMVPGPQNIRMTGILCASGPDATPGVGDHQDCIQIQSNGNNYLVNVSGCLAPDGWDFGSSTQGAGGALFWSLNNPKAHVRGGQYQGCNHSLEVDTRELGTGIRESTIKDAGFRSGYPATWCLKGNFNTGNPCTGSVSQLAEFSNVTCQRWLFGEWRDVAPTG